MSSNSVCNHICDKQIGLPLRGRPILLSLVWLLNELDSTQSYYHYLFVIIPFELWRREYRSLVIIIKVKTATLSTEESGRYKGGG